MSSRESWTCWAYLNVMSDAWLCPDGSLAYGRLGKVHNSSEGLCISIEALEKHCWRYSSSGQGTLVKPV